MREKILYPLKFMPIFKEKIWGGTAIEAELGLKADGMEKCGEAWMLSGLENDDSVVANGFLEGNTLSELLEIYMGDLVGEAIYKQYGCLFPLLFKWIDAQDDLSVQVHPNNELAIAKEGGLGKTEMWYVRKASPGAKLICGFKENVSKDVYIKALEDNRIERVLESYSLKEGDAFFIPSGTVHALRAGTLVAEIQQSSDITYRIYDWDRKDDEGKERELHREEALEALHFNDEHHNCKNEDHSDLEQGGGPIHYHPLKNETQTLVSSTYFTVNHLLLTQAIQKDISDLDSFIVYMCNAGRAVIKAEDKAIEIGPGEIVLIPACYEILEVFPDHGGCEFLETYISQNK